jgi:signal transduction histidine kinase
MIRTDGYVARLSWNWLLLLPVAGLSLGIVILPHEPPFAEYPLDYLFDAVTGAVITLAGLVAWDRRPGRRVGRLLVVAGYLWYVGSLYEFAAPQTSVPFLAFALRGYYDAILAFVILAFPGDQLESRRDRVAVGALLVAMLVRTAWRLVGTQPGIGTGNPPDAPANPLLLVQDGDTFIHGDIVLTFVVGLALAGVAVAIVLRRRSIRPGAQWVSDPVLLGGFLWATLAALYTIASSVGYWFEIQIVPTDGPGWTAQYLLRMLGPIGLLVGALRLRRRTSAVVGVMAGQAGPPRGPELERALRSALDDPSLELLYPAGAGWTTASGATVALPALDAGRAATVLESDGRACGAIVHDASLLDDTTFVRTMAAVVRLAVENERLETDLQAQLDEVRASRARIVEATDVERRRLERDLHDGAQQRLVALAVSLRIIRSRLGPDVSGDVAAELEAAGDEVRGAIAELRELAHGLDPSILREAGLGAAVQSLADRSPVPVRVDIDVAERLPASVETTAYFVASEALANIAKHSGASAAHVRASRLDDWLQLEVADDGIGGADPAGDGLRGLMDRIAAVDGRFDLQTQADGGTRIAVSIPCA